MPEYFAYVKSPCALRRMVSLVDWGQGRKRGIGPCALVCLLTKEGR